MQKFISNTNTVVIISCKYCSDSNLWTRQNAFHLKPDILISGLDTVTTKVNLMLFLRKKIKEKVVFVLN